MPDCYSLPFFPPDQRPHTEKSTFYRISQGLPFLLESNIGCFQRVPSLGTIVYKAFFVTRQQSEDLVILLFRHCDTFPLFGYFDFLHPTG